MSCPFKECDHVGRHHHICIHCGKKNVHRSADCDAAKSSKDSYPPDLRGAIVRMVAGAVKKSLDKAHKNVQAAAGKC